MQELREQFGKIYDQYIDKIYRFVYLKVNSRDVAEDITSSVFLKGWEAYQKQGANIENPRAFLYQIARNAVVDHYRQKGKANLVSSDVLPEIADFSTDALDKAVLGADISVVKACIQKIKPESQDIIIWHYLDDMPISEIAQMVGKPAGTVRVMLHRALKELKGVIQES